jgi:hypothetical protein
MITHLGCVYKPHEVSIFARNLVASVFVELMSVGGWGLLENVT